MNISYAKYRRALNGEKMPRKLKKQILGKKMKKSKLKTLISTLEIKTDGYNVRVLPFTFCPICGCEGTRCVDHQVEYPEVWVEEFCLRCGEFVGGADNSRYHHVLEELVSP